MQFNLSITEFRDYLFYKQPNIFNLNFHLFGNEYRNITDS